MAEPGRTPAAELMASVWSVLSELLGTAAAATMLRRAARRGASRIPNVAALVVTREGLDYTYALPPAWNDPQAAGTIAEIRALVREELHPLLRELTGDVVVRRLERIPGLSREGTRAEKRHGQ